MSEEMNDKDIKKGIKDQIEGEEETVVEDTATEESLDEADEEVFSIRNEVDTGYGEGEKQSDRIRCFMYTQRLDTVLNIWGSLDAFEDFIKNKLCSDPADMCAFIVQNKDASKVPGQQFAIPHIHAAIKLKGAKTLTAIAKALKDYRADGTPNVQTITIFRKNVNNMFSYLCHRTTGAKNKYQYSFDEVVANFDYKELMDNIAREIEKARKKSDANLATMLELLRSGEVTMQEVCERIPASTLGACLPRIRNVNSFALECKADKWRKMKLITGIPTIVIWVCGKSGTGKSRFARQVIKSYDEPYYIGGSSRGIWERYQGEHIVLLDELRPNCIESYRDLLSILDNYQERSVAPSRYNDKELMLELVVVTSVLSPYEFYLQSVASEDRDIDPFHQLERRISSCVIMEDEWILNASFDEDAKAYVPDLKGLARNVYSEYNNPDTAVYSSSRIFYDTVYRASSIAKRYAEFNKDLMPDEETLANDDSGDDYSDDMGDYIDDAIYEEMIEHLDDSEEYDEYSDYDESGEEIE